MKKLLLAVLVLVGCEAVQTTQPESREKPREVAPITFDSWWNCRGVTTLMSDGFGWLDPARWTKGQPWGPGIFLDENVTTEAGVLTLHSSETPTSWRPWSSGMVTTRDKFWFTYGLIEFRAKVPAGMGFFPSVWLLPQWGETKLAPDLLDEGEGLPEIDVMEFRGRLPQLSRGVLFDREATAVTAFDFDAGEDLSADWHVWTLEWSPGRLAWRMDGQLMNEYTGAEVPDVPMYILITFGIPGDNEWVGEPDETTPWGATFEIDWIGVWTHA